MKAYNQFYRDFQYITEIEMSKMFNKFTQKEIPVGIITTFKRDLDRKTNIDNIKSLASFCRHKENFGFCHVDGAWIENQGKDNETAVPEDSIFVSGHGGIGFNKFSKHLQIQAKEYDQDAFLAYDHEIQILKIIDRNGVVIEKISEVERKDIETAITKFRRNGYSGDYIFERVRYSLGWIARMTLRGEDTSEVML